MAGLPLIQARLRKVGTPAALRAVEIGIENARALGLPPLAIRTAVRTGDTPQKDRALMRKRPPHILVTTPESLYVLLGSDYPQIGLDTTVEAFERLDLTADEKAKIRSGNALTLFNR